MRKQYHFRPTEQCVLIWDVNKLVELTVNFPRKLTKVTEIPDLDGIYWSNGKTTCRSLVEHIKMIQEVDMNYPIILSSKGYVMDGMHRVCRALLDGIEYIEAVQFEVDPDPDYIDVDEADLPYE